MKKKEPKQDIQYPLCTNEIDLLYFGLFVDVYCHFQQYFSYIVPVSFIGGGNQMIRRKPPNCRKSLTNFITQCCTPRPD